MNDDDGQRFVSHQRPDVLGDFPLLVHLFGGSCQWSHKWTLAALWHLGKGSIPWRSPISCVMMSETMSNWLITCFKGLVLLKCGLDGHLQLDYWMPSCVLTLQMTSNQLVTYWESSGRVGPWWLHTAKTVAGLGFHSLQNVPTSEKISILLVTCF